MFYLQISNDICILTPRDACIFPCFYILIKRRLKHPPRIERGEVFVIPMHYVQKMYGHRLVEEASGVLTELMLTLSHNVATRKVTYLCKHLIFNSAHMAFGLLRCFL